MGRPKKFENRREIIVETGAALFRERGFEGTTMDDIAKACDMGKATVYAEFSSKEQLMNEVITGYIKQAQLEIKQMIEASTGNYMGTLREVLLHRVLGTFERANKHFHSMETMMAARKDARAKMQGYREEEIRILANLLEKAANNGEMVKQDSYFRLAKLLRKGLTGLFPPHIFNISPEEFAQDAREIIGIYVAGLTLYTAELHSLEK